MRESVLIRLHILIGALPENVWFVDWFHQGYSLDVFPDGTDRELVATAAGFLQGTCAALGHDTLIELFNHFDITLSDIASIAHES